MYHPTTRLNRQATKEAHHHPQHQAPTQVPDCLYSKGAHMQQHKKRVMICLNNNRCKKNPGQIHTSQNHTYIKHEPQYHIFIVHPYHNQSPITMLIITFKITRIHTRVLNNLPTSHLHNHYVMHCNIDSTHAWGTESTNSPSSELGPLFEP